MKTKDLTRYLYNILFITLVATGIWVALIVYKYYAYVARGILGVVLFYLLYYFGRYTKLDLDSMDVFLLYPAKGRYLMLVFIYSVISGRAAIQIYAMVLFYWPR
jgi:hypothetical protein